MGRVLLVLLVLAAAVLPSTLASETTRRRALLQTPSPPPFVREGNGSTNSLACWKEVYTRGVGSVPSVCDSGTEKSGLFCYPPCRSGYSGIGRVCAQDCPSGFRNDGAFCAKPAEYGRGAGYPWKFGDGLNDNGMFDRCGKANGGRGNCEKCGAIVYPKCRANFRAIGCNICSPRCQAGTDIGVSCTKPTYDRGEGTALKCPSGQDQDGLLCYDPCNKPGFKALGAMCGQSQAPSQMPEECGLFYAKPGQCQQVLAQLGIPIGTAIGAVIGCGAASLVTFGALAGTCAISALTIAGASARFGTYVSANLEPCSGLS